jgi:hypothetical protein
VYFGSTSLSKIVPRCGPSQGLDPEAYLIDVIKRLAHDATTEQAAALTPARIAGEHRAERESA